VPIFVQNDTVFSYTYCANITESITIKPLCKSEILRLLRKLDKKGEAVSENQTESAVNSWIKLGAALKRRTCEPFSHVSFVIYFLVAVIIIGGIGIWIELYAYLLPPSSPATPTVPLAPLRSAIVTFFPALTASACLQLIWAENEHKFLRSFGVLFLTLMTMAALIISPHAMGNGSALTVGILASLAALWAWWIANAEQKDFLDIDNDAPLGGKTTNAKLSGDLDGFKVV